MRAATAVYAETSKFARGSPINWLDVNFAMKMSHAILGGCLRLETITLGGSILGSSDSNMPVCLDRSFPKAMSMKYWFYPLVRPLEYFTWCWTVSKQHVSSSTPKNHELIKLLRLPLSTRHHNDNLSPEALIVQRGPSRGDLISLFLNYITLVTLFFERKK